MSRKKVQVLPGFEVQTLRSIKLAGQAYLQDCLTPQKKGTVTPAFGGDFTKFDQGCP